MKNIYWVIIGVVVLGAIWALSKNMPFEPAGEPFAGPATGSPTPTGQGETASPMPGTDGQAGPGATDTPGASVPTYAQALAIYKNRRIQLDANCHADPDDLTVKENTKIMVDNRSAGQMRITLDNRSFLIPGFGFYILTMYTDQPLPYDFKLACHSNTAKTEASAVITIQ